VRLNRAAAIAMRDGPAAGLGELDRLDGDAVLTSYHLYYAARADLLRRLQRRGEAALAYREALERVTSPVERRYLERRLAEMSRPLSE
jgi:RNA polymerase sigma-70 factor (ECF subfamily)